MAFGNCRVRAELAEAFVRQSGIDLNKRRNEQDIVASCAPQFRWCARRRTGQEGFDTHHMPTTTVRAHAQRFSSELLVVVTIVLSVAGSRRGRRYKARRRGCRGAQQLAAQGELRFTMTVCQESVVPDAHQSAW